VAVLAAGMFCFPQSRPPARPQGKDAPALLRQMDGSRKSSARQTPPDTDAARTVYIAWNALTADPSLSAEETCRQRQTLFEALQFMDWSSFRGLGEAGRETETVMAFLQWLQSQTTLSRPELTGLLLGGAGRSNLDGAYADRYSAALTQAFLNYPTACCEILSGEDITDNDRAYVIGGIAYGAYPESVRRQALTAADAVTRDGRDGVTDVAQAIQTRLQQEL